MLSHWTCTKCGKTFNSRKKIDSCTLKDKEVDYHLNEFKERCGPVEWIPPGVKFEKSNGIPVDWRCVKCLKPVYDDEKIEYNLHGYVTWGHITRSHQTCGPLSKGVRRPEMARIC